MHNLYEQEDFFQLIIDFNEYFINEPISWDTVMIKLSRDAITYGFNYEFVSDDIQLEFPEYEGLELIRDYYKLKGSDGTIVLKYGYVDKLTAQQVVLFTGNLNLNTLSFTPRGCTCQIEKQAFENLIRTRLETKVDLNANTTKDGAPIFPCPYMVMQLHSKTIKKQSTFHTPDANPLSGTYLFSGFIQDAFTLLYLQPDTLSTESEEIEVISNAPPGFMDGFPPDLSLFQLKPTEAGSTTVKFNISTTITINAQSIEGGFAQPTQVTLTPYLILKRGSLYNTYNELPTIQYFTGPTFLKTFLYESGPCEFSVSVEVNDELYIGVSMSGLSQQGDPLHFRSADVTNYKNDISFVQESSAPTTTCQVYNAFDAMNYVIESISGIKDAIKSDYLEAGCGAQYAITNGFQIRNFEPAKRPVQCSLSDLVLGLSNIFNMGTGYQTQPDGKEIVLFEQMDKFYSGQGIIDDFKQLFNYTETHDSTVVFNETEVGFEKFSDEGLNTIDDFSTYHEYLLPIKTFKAKKAIRSGLIASGYSIEIQRREQFKTNPSSSIENDDDLFIINYIEGDRIYPSIEYSVVMGEFETVFNFAREVGLIVGSQFKIEGSAAGPNDGVVYTVHEKLQGYFERYDVFPAPDFGSGAVKLTIITIPPTDLPAGVPYVLAARDESFTSVAGLISPSTTYNLKISPKRILLNWASFFNIGLTKKEPNDLVVNNFVKSNKDLTTVLPAGYTCSRPGSYREGDGVLLQDWGYAIRPFMPVRVKFDTSITYDRLNNLKKYLRGEGPNANMNFGLISFVDLEGLPWVGHVIDIAYNPAKELATFQVYKKAEL